MFNVSCHDDYAVKRKIVALLERRIAEWQEEAGSSVHFVPRADIVEELQFLLDEVHGVRV